MQKLRIASSLRRAAAGRSVRALSELKYAGIHPDYKFVNEMEVQPEMRSAIDVFRLLQPDGSLIEGADAEAAMGQYSDEQLVEMQKAMIQISVLDRVLYDSQRQGRISFYMTSTCEEATHIGTAEAMAPQDHVFLQYREVGVLMWRGFSLQQICDQCFSNVDDLGKGRQMPVHYGSKELNVHTISSPLATQLPQAAGAAYAFKRDNVNAADDEKRAAWCFFGDGSASEGDFHAGMNFASTLQCPVVFVVRNNGYAISTPVSDQYRGDGIASRASGYGMHSIRCDGNDLLAVLKASNEARRMAVEENKPVLLEVMTYRAGHHSTSDDSTRYRTKDEINGWVDTTSPISRLGQFLKDRGVWSQDMAQEVADDARKQVLAAFQTAAKKKKPALNELFTDVYTEEPQNLQRQRKQLKEHLAKYPDEYDLSDLNEQTL